MKLSPHKSGLTVGGFLGFWHVIWSLLVVLLVAQPFIDWIFRLHMIQPVYHVAPFDFFTALTLVIIASVFGYLLGYVFALIWNALHKS